MQIQTYGQNMSENRLTYSNDLENDQNDFLIRIAASKQCTVKKSDESKPNRNLMLNWFIEFVKGL